MGATFMVAPDPTPGPDAEKDKETAESIVLVMPSEKEKQRQVFDYYATLGKTYGLKSPRDEGQQYMSIEFAGFDEDAFRRNNADDDDDEK